MDKEKTDGTMEFSAGADSALWDRFLEKVAEAEPGKAEESARKITEWTLSAFLKGLLEGNKDATNFLRQIDADEFGEAVLGLEGLDLVSLLEFWAKPEGLVLPARLVEPDGSAWDGCWRPLAELPLRRLETEDGRVTYYRTGDIWPPEGEKLPRRCVHVVLEGTDDGHGFACLAAGVSEERLTDGGWIRTRTLLAPVGEGGAKAKHTFTDLRKPGPPVTEFDVTDTDGADGKTLEELIEETVLSLVREKDTFKWSSM